MSAPAGRHMDFHLDSGKSINQRVSAEGPGNKKAAAQMKIE